MMMPTHHSTLPCHCSAKLHKDFHKALKKEMKIQSEARQLQRSILASSPEVHQRDMVRKYRGGTGRFAIISIRARNVSIRMFESAKRSNVEEDKRSKSWQSIRLFTVATTDALAPNGLPSGILSGFSNSPELSRALSIPLIHTL